MDLEGDDSSRGVAHAYSAELRGIALPHGRFYATFGTQASRCAAVDKRTLFTATHGRVYAAKARLRAALHGCCVVILISRSGCRPQLTYTEPSLVDFAVTAPEAPVTLPHVIQAECAAVHGLQHRDFDVQSIHCEPLGGGSAAGPRERTLAALPWCRPLTASAAPPCPPQWPPSTRWVA